MPNDNAEWNREVASRLSSVETKQDNLAAIQEEHTKLLQQLVEDKHKQAGFIGALLLVGGLVGTLMGFLGDKILDFIK